MEIGLIVIRQLIGYVKFEKCLIGGKMKYLEIAKKILPALGGKENLVRVHNCLTRLRTTVKEPSWVKVEELENIDEVKSVIVEGSEVHVVLGAGTAKKVTEEIIRMFDVPRKP